MAGDILPVAEKKILRNIPFERLGDNRNGLARKAGSMKCWRVLSGWLSWVRSAGAGLALAGGVWAQAAGAAEIKNVTAKYAWPWGVCISYEVLGQIMDDILVVTATDQASNATYTAQVSALSGDTGVYEGVHHVVWDLDKQGVKINSTNVVFSVMHAPLYCVVDLSGGANALVYPVTWIDTLPDGGFNTDIYKTTKLVLRRIDPGSFKMSGTYETTLTMPFYIGIFEVTQTQYQLVMGDNPSSEKGDKRPVERVSYNDIRGSSSGAEWPENRAVDASSFLGRMRSKTGLTFDLPTEAQWEYACRAGTTTAYNNGGNKESDLTQLGRYYGNIRRYTTYYGSGGVVVTNITQMGDGKGGYLYHHTTVGCYKPNAWGLYDMHGNVAERCLDWYGNLSGGVTDPKGASLGTNRVYRGGSWYDGASSCTSSARSKDYYPTSNGSRSTYVGFRLVRILSQ